MRRARLALAVLAAVACATASAQPEPVDSSAVAFFRGEPGQVMDHALWLTDVHGARLTGSPSLDAAQRWARDRFASWGVAARLEPWGTFGRGWSLTHFAAEARVAGPDVAAQTIPLYAVPRAWSPSVGTVDAELVVLDPDDADAYERVAGTLAGKAVLLARPVAVDLGLEPIATRRTPEQLLELANAPMPAAAARGRTPGPDALARQRAAQERRNRLFAERPAVLLDASNTPGHGAIRAMQAQVPMAPGATTRARPWEPGVETVPQVVLLDEHANRLMRLVAAGQRVTLRLSLEAAFTPEPVVEENVIGEIAGGELAGESVMLGGHLDSWHAGSGATDNAAGSAVVMEAARLLARYYETTGTRPRRTIRFGLWTGEEQGLLGSIGFVNQRYATIPAYGQPATDRTAESETVSAYFNLDNGSGRIRGVHLQANAAVEPIFRAWLDALADPSAQTLTLRNTGGTDHLAFDAAGIPGFQFIQDGLAYGTQTWHTSMDTYDHLAPDDLQQAAVVMAVFAHHAAMRDERLPRKPVAAADAAAPAGRGMTLDDDHDHDH